jgi:hypothetical protein
MTISLFQYSAYYTTETHMPKETRLYRNSKRHRIDIIDDMLLQYLDKHVRIETNNTKDIFSKGQKRQK